MNVIRALFSPLLLAREGQGKGGGDGGGGCWSEVRTWEGDLQVTFSFS